MKSESNISTSVYKVCEGKVVSQIIDDEAIIINMETGSYYSLDKIGSEIWHLLEQTASAAQITDVMQSRYDGSTTEISTEIVKLLQSLEAENLVEIVVAENRQPVASELQPGPDSTLPAFTSPRFEKHSDMQDFLLVDPIHQVDDRGWPHKDNT